MPTTTGLSEEAALQALTAAGIELVTIETEFSVDVLEGFVTRSEPAAGGVVGRQQTVTIWISDGPEPFAVPDLIGASIAEAETLAEEFGFVLVVESGTLIVSDPALEGVIAAQTPDTGEIRPGDEILVQLGELLKVEVPDLIGKTIDEADEILDALGLVLEIIGSTQVEEGSSLDGNIATQIPESGEVPLGSAIQVTIGTLGPGGTTPPPSP
jgi:serine/threonine-protein kinase